MEQGSPQTVNVNIDLGFKPRAWQQKCIDSREKYTVLVVHRRAGKTVLAAQTLFSYALNKPGGMYAYVMPELKQGRIVAWPVFKNIMRKVQGLQVDATHKIDLARAYESDNTIRFNNGSEIKLLGSDNPDSIRGAKLAGVVMDEVAQMPREVWTEVIMPALLDSNGWALFIGTPKGINLFSELYERGNDPAFPNWKSMVFTVYETDALSPEQIAEYKSACSEEEFKREMLCDFTASTEDQLISISDVVEAMDRYKEQEYKGDPKSAYGENLVLGVDVARTGGDRSVIFLRCGLRAELVVQFYSKDLNQVADAVKKAYEHYRPSAIYIDGTGLGSGVVDIVRARHVPCFDVNFSSASSDPIYNNKRTEIWCRMAQWVKDKGCLNPECSGLKVDLCAPCYERSENGVYSLESKKDIKRRLGMSPDLGDALALTFTNYIPEIEVSERDCVDMGVTQVKPARYNPFEQFERDISEPNEHLSRVYGSHATLQARMGLPF